MPRRLGLSLLVVCLGAGCQPPPEDVGWVRAASHPCTSVMDRCDDANPCTRDVCDTAAGQCAHLTIEGCCRTVSDCETPPCVNPRCFGGTCRYDPVPGCDAGPRSRDAAGPPTDAAPPGPDASPPTDAGGMDGGAPADAGAMDGGAPDGTTQDAGPVPVRGGACSVGRPGGSRPSGLLLLLGLALSFVRRRAGRAIAGLALIACALATAAPARAQGFRADGATAPTLPGDLSFQERPAPAPARVRPGVRLDVGYADDLLVVATTPQRGIVAERLSTRLTASLAFLERAYVSVTGSLHVQGGLGARAVDTAHPLLESPAAGEPALDARVVLLDRADPIELGLAATVRLPVGSAGFASDEVVSFAPRVLVGRALDDRGSFVALSVGVDVRGETQLGDLSVGSTLTWTLGGAVALAEHASVTAELAGQTVLARAFDAAHTPLEGALGVRWHDGPFAVGASLGGGLTPGFGSPDLQAQLYVGSWIPVE